MARTPRPELARPDLVALALERARDRQSAYSEYIRLHWQTTGKLAPGCDARDFFAAYDALVASRQATTAEVAP